MQWETIVKECQCENCGLPLRVGDRALFSLETLAAACSSDCMAHVHFLITGKIVVFAPNCAAV